MTKVSEPDLSRIRNQLNSTKKEEIRLIVAKDVAAKFRQVAKRSGLTAVALFEEMVEAHAGGM